MGKTTMIKLLRDSRDLIYAKHYGQTTIFPNEYNADSSTPDTIQAPGNVECTCITTCDIACDQTNTQYDYNELFNRVPHDLSGANPRDAIKEAVKNGLKKATSDQVDKKWKSFYRADDGGMDIFDNVRSAIYLAQSPVAFATPWYENWTSAPSILPFGNNVTNYHMYSVEGWTEINGVPQLIVEAWIGRKLYMCREVCNAVMSAFGSQAWVLATDEIDARRTKNILEKIIDACVNAIILLKQALILQAQEKPMDPIKPTEETPSSKLYDIAKSFLKKHLTLDERVPKETGCAQALSYVLKEAGYHIPPKGISSTQEMYQWLRENFDEVESGGIGKVIINVSFTGKPGLRGHCGVIGQWQIMSNDSDTGLWSAHWNIENWKPFYEGTGGMKTHYFQARG